MAPIALYPDSLLTQVLVASTYPLDIVKADRFIADNTDLADNDRADQAERRTGTRASRSSPAASRRSSRRWPSELDWTEELGDAMLAQSDDVLDAVQRQRARAVAVGNLTTNEAQVVEEADDNITIAPAEPEVVYVPQYDATTAYTTPYTQPAVIDPGYSTSNWSPPAPSPSAARSSSTRSSTTTTTTGTTTGTTTTTTTTSTGTTATSARARTSTSTAT